MQTFPVFRWHKSVLVSFFIIPMALVFVFGIGSPAEVKQVAAQTSSPTTQFGINSINPPVNSISPSDGFNASFNARNIANASNIGAVWDRWPVQWYWVEQPWISENTFLWSGTFPLNNDKFDLLSAAQGAQGMHALFPRINTLVVFHGVPRRYDCTQTLSTTGTDLDLNTDCDIAQPPHPRIKGLFDPFTVNGTNRWGNYVHWVTTNLVPYNITYFETWNEPDLQWRAAGDSADPERSANPPTDTAAFLNDYVQMVQTTLDSKDPNAQIILGAPQSPGDDQAWLWGQATWSAINAATPNISNRLRAVAIHSYEWPFRTWTLADLVRGIFTSRPDIPVWVTESGLHYMDGQENDYDALHIAYVFQEAVYARVAGVEVNIHYAMRDEQERTGQGNKQLGLSDSSGALLHPANALRSAITYLSSAQLGTSAQNYMPQNSNPASFENFVASYAYTRMAFDDSTNNRRVTVVWANQTTATTAQIPQQSGTCPATLYDQEGNDQTSLLQASGGFYNINLQPADSSPANTSAGFPLVGGPAYILVETSCTQPTPTTSAQISGGGIEVVFQYPFDQSHQLVIQRQESDPLVLATRLRAAVPMKTIIQPWLAIITIPMVPSPQYSYFDQVIVPGHEYCYRSELYQNGAFVGTSNEVCVTSEASTYPYGIQSVSTIPDAIAPLKDLPGLFDGDAVEGNFALINYTPDPVSIVMEFNSPVTLSGFDSTIGGYHGIPDGNTWSIAADDQGNGNFQSLVSGVPSDAGPVRILLPAPHTAKVFKVTTQRLNGDGAVHMSELTPLFVSNAGGSISGIIYDSSGGANIPLAGAYIQVCKIGGRCAVTASGPDGSYSVGNLETGQYFVTALSPAGQSFIQQRIGPLSISSGSTLTGQDIFFHGPTTPPPGTTITSVGTTADGLPIVYWDDPLTLNTQGCAGGTAHYALLQDGVAKRSGFMSEISPGSYQVVLDPLSPIHGPASIEIAISCPNGSQQTVDFDLYIDPSGLVRTTYLAPIVDATVSLFRADTPEGPFEFVLDGSALMSPMNRSNPSLSDANGHFGWDVVAGYYKVRASKAGCVSPDDPGLDYVESPVLTIPPAVMDLDLRLDCGAPEPTFAPTPEASETPSPTATSMATETPTLTLTPPPTATSTPSITTISGLRTLLHDQYQQGQVKRSFYRTLNTLLLIADRLERHGNQRAAVVQLLVFKRIVQRESGHLITAEAARQLIDATQQVILALR